MQSYRQLTPHQDVFKPTVTKPSLTKTTVLGKALTKPVVHQAGGGQGDQSGRRRTEFMVKSTWNRTTTLIRKRWNKTTLIKPKIVKTAGDRSADGPVRGDGRQHDVQQDGQKVTSKQTLTRPTFTKTTLTKTPLGKKTLQQVPPGSGVTEPDPRWDALWARWEPSCQRSRGAHGGRTKVSLTRRSCRTDRRG
jgi:hypothetical protein